MEKNYYESIKEHANECYVELDVLSVRLKNQSMNSTDFYAAERVLQVLIEAAIGLAKQWTKELSKALPNDAYQAFIVLHEHHKITKSELLQWKKIIGLRNTLVHDYLNVERNIIEHILEDRSYLFVINFIKSYQ